MLYRVSSTAILLFCALATWAAAPSLLDRTPATLNGMQAEFKQSFTARGFKTAQIEKGKVQFGSLPQMRWSYESPEQKLFVFDGTNSWFYVPADRQVTTGRVTEARKRELPFLLLGDPAARERHFVTSQKAKGNTVEVTLQARDPRSLIPSVRLTLAKDSGLVQRIDYADREGNRTSFQFSGYHRRPAGADTFRFAPPAGVQIIRAD